jgi:hypothetical protein
MFHLIRAARSFEMFIKRGFVAVILLVTASAVSAAPPKPETITGFDENEGVTHVRFSSDGKTLILIGQRSVFHRDMKSRQLKKVLLENVPDKNQCSFCVSPDGTLIASSKEVGAITDAAQLEAPGEVLMWDTLTGKQSGKLTVFWLSAGYQPRQPKDCNRRGRYWQSLYSTSHSRLEYKNRKGRINPHRRAV